MLSTLPCIPSSLRSNSVVFVQVKMAVGVLQYFYLQHGRPLLWQYSHGLDKACIGNTGMNY